MNSWIYKWLAVPFACWYTSNKNLKETRYNNIESFLCLFANFHRNNSYNFTFCFSSVYWNAFEYIILLFFPSSVYRNKSESFSTREKATYSSPCEKHGFPKFSLHTCGYCSSALLMVITKASSTGNWRRLNSFVVLIE